MMTKTAKQSEGDKGTHKQHLSRVKNEFDGFIKSAILELRQRQRAHSLLNRQKFTSGKIDTKRLGHYKTSGDIFKQYVVDGHQKSHGMYILVDFSASMSDIIKKVLEQTYAIATFCKSSGIDFSVVSFTTGNTKVQTDSMGGISPGFNMIEWMTADLSQKDIDVTYRKMRESIGQGGWSNSGRLGLGGTPLTESYAAFRSYVLNRRMINKVELANVVLFSDGCGSQGIYRIDPGGTNNHYNTTSVTSGDFLCDSETGMTVEIPLTDKHKNEYYSYNSTAPMAALNMLLKKDRITTVMFYMYSSGKNGPKMQVADYLPRLIGSFYSTNSEKAIKKIVDQYKLKFQKDSPIATLKEGFCGFGGTIFLDAGMMARSNSNGARKVLAKEIVRLVCEQVRS